MIVNNIKELRAAVEENNRTAGGLEIELVAYGEYEFDGEPIVITSPLKIDGKYAHMVCNYKTVFVVAASDTVITAIKFEHVFTSVNVDGRGKKISNIEISYLQSKDVKSRAIGVCNTLSNSVVSNVRIVHNVFIGKTGREEETMDAFTVPISLAACSASDEKPVDNCIVENVDVLHNTTKGGHRFGINLTTSLCDYNGGLEKCGWRTNPVIRNIRILDNDLDGGWDSTINFIGGVLHQKNGLMENIEIGYNRVCYGLWGMAVVAEEPLFGPMEDSLVRGFDVHHNVFVPQADGAGEIKHAIAFCSGRIDYFHGAGCKNAGIENVKVHHNEIRDTDRGFLISATDSVLDGAKSTFDSCYLSGIEISDNRLIGVSEAFLIAGAYFEGRLFDWNIGVPRHNKHWSDLFPTNDVESCTLVNNFVDKVVIKNNYIKGNRYMYRLHACFAHGHAVMKNNRLSIDEISGNVFEEYEGHCDIKTMFIDDWVKDGGGNEFDESWKMKI